MKHYRHRMRRLPGQRSPVKQQELDEAPALEKIGAQSKGDSLSSRTEPYPQKADRSHGGADARSGWADESSPAPPRLNKMRLPSLEDPSNKRFSVSMAFIGGMALATLLFNAYLLFTHTEDVWMVMGLSVLVLLAMRMYFETRIASGAYENNLKGARVRSLMEFTIFGVVAPGLLLLYILFAGASTLLAFDPLGWARFAGLTATLPIINLYLRHRVVHGARNSRTLFYLNGFAMGVGIFWSIVFLVLAIFNSSVMLTGQAVFLLTPYAALVCNTYMLYKLSHYGTNSVDSPGKLPALLGVLSSVLLLAGPELRALAVGGAERVAVSDNKAMSGIGMGALAVLGAQEDLQRQAAPNWNRTQLMIMPSLVGLPPDQAHTLYFRLTGKDANESNNLSGGLIPNFMPEFVRAAAPDLIADRDTTRGGTSVGDMIPGLGVSHSTITGHIDTKTLTAALYWTLIFKNDSKTAQEARAQIALPRGAVVSRATLWIDGKPEEAAFNSVATTRQAYESLALLHRDPLLISSTGKDQVLMQAFPIPANGGEMKVRIGITAPLAIVSPNDGQLALPKLLQANFKLEGNNDVHLEANQFVGANNSKLQSVVNGDSVLMRGNIDHDQLKTVLLQAHWTGRPSQVAARASHTAGGGYIIGRIGPVVDPVSRLLVLVDGSDALNGQIEEVTTALSRIPGNVSSLILYANDQAGAGDRAESSVVPRIQLQDALEELRQKPFGYGQHNGPALIEAMEMAGDDPGAAILWIHGPQPVLSTRDKNALSTVGLKSKLRIFDYTVRGGNNALLSLLQNKARVIPISRQFSVHDDLGGFVSSLSKEPAYTVKFDKTKLKPAGTIDMTPPVVSRMSTLWAAQSAESYLASGDQSAAGKLGEVYRIVTPASSAVVLPDEGNYQRWGLHRNESMVVSNDLGNQTTAIAQLKGAYANSVAVSSAASQGSSGSDGTSVAPPTLQGATNGTIGPQGSDATSIQGVNTAGTVRLNNLANLEALLNVIANGFEVVGLCWGGTTLFTTIFGAFSAEDACRRILFGCSSILAGLVSPGCINWLVASSRDANLFS